MHTLSSLKNGNQVTVIIKIMHKPLTIIISYIHSILIRIFPPNKNIPRAGNIYVETLGLLGLFLYLANINLQSDLFSTGEILLGVSFLLAWKQLRILLSQPIFWLMLLWVLAVTASAISGIHRFPFVDSLEQLDEARKMALYALLVPIGWWIGPNLTSIRNALLITCLGFVIAALPWILDWNTLGPMLEGKRPGRDILGFWTIQYATWAGLLLLAVAFMGKELLPEPLRYQKGLFLGYTLLIIISICLVLGVYVTLSRMIWISLFLSIPFGIILYIITSPRTKQRLFNLTSIIAILLMILVLGFAQLDKISERFSRDSETIENIMKGDWEEIEKRGLGTRIHQYRWALNTDEFISIFGWGPMATEIISDHERLRNAYNYPELRNHPHLHNDLLEILLRTGIFGTTIIALTISYMIKGLLTGLKLKNFPHFLFVFLITAMFYFFLTGLTNFSFRIQSIVPVLGGITFATILLLPIKYDRCIQ